MLFKSGNTNQGELPFKQGEAAAVDAVDRFLLADLPQHCKYLYEQLA
jgi:hypothetical protein